MNSEAALLLQHLATLGAKRHDQTFALTIELVYPQPRALAEVQRQIAALLPITTPSVRAAFDPQSDRLFFLTLPDINSAAPVGQFFSLARQLAAALGLEEANPSLNSSPSALLLGQAMPDLWPGEGWPHDAPHDDAISPAQDNPVLQKRGWALQHINVPRVWPQAKGTGIRVAVIDTGYSDHNELSGTIETTADLNLLEGGFHARDRFNHGPLRNPGHGTLVSSVIASRGHVDPNANTTQPGEITGSAPDATLVHIRAIRSVVHVFQHNFPAAINHAIQKDCDVVVIAWGGLDFCRSTRIALEQAVAEGMVVVCAAGNHVRFVVSPALYAKENLCTCVAATNHANNPWTEGRVFGTSRGQAVVISAPGEDVWGARQRTEDASPSEVRACSGTTLAASLTAGVAALWFEAKGGRQALRARAEAAGTTVQAMFNACVSHQITKPDHWHNRGDLGAGILNAESVLKAPLPEPLRASRPAAGAPASSAATAMQRTAEPASAGDTGAVAALGELLRDLAAHPPPATPAATPLATATTALPKALHPYAPELIWMLKRQVLLELWEEQPASLEPLAGERMNPAAAIHQHGPSAELQATLADLGEVGLALRQQLGLA